MINDGDLRSLAGATVTSQGSDKIGKVVDVHQSTDGSTGTFVTVPTGLFGSHASFVPLQDATRSGEDLVVPYDKDLVKQAPRVDTDEDLTAEEEDRLYAHYSLSGGSTASATGAGTTEAAWSGTEGTGTRRTDAEWDGDQQTGTQRTGAEWSGTEGKGSEGSGRARLRRRIGTETDHRTGQGEVDKGVS